MTITEFLEARIAEDEAQATNVLVFRMNPRTNMPGNQAIPARVRAECAAKRAIIEMHGPVRDDGWKSGAAHDYLWCGMCGSVDDSPEPYPCPTLKALAAVYASHPDYQQEWAL